MNISISICPASLEYTDGDTYHEGRLLAAIREFIEKEQPGATISCLQIGHRRGDEWARIDGDEEAGSDLLSDFYTRHGDDEGLFEEKEEPVNKLFISTGFLAGNLEVDDTAEAQRLADSLATAIRQQWPDADVKVPWQHGQGSVPFGLRTYVTDNTPSNFSQTEAEVEEFVKEFFELRTTGIGLSAETLCKLSGLSLEEWGLDEGCTVVVFPDCIGGLGSQGHDLPDLAAGNDSLEDSVWQAAFKWAKK